jgi:hypothetical protein
MIEKNTQSENRRPAWMAPLKIALGMLATWLLLAIFAYLLFWISGIFGCQINEGGTSPCNVGGFDIQVLIMLPAMLAAFGVPFFLLGIGGCILVAAVLFLIGQISKRSIAKNGRHVLFSAATQILIRTYDKNRPLLKQDFSLGCRMLSKCRFQSRVDKLSGRLFSGF